MRTYDWVPIDVESAESSFFSHPGATVDSVGRLYLGASSGREIHRLTNIHDVTTFAVPTVEVHGLATSVDGRIWIADPGTKSRLQNGELVTEEGAGRVIAVSAQGELLAELKPPNHFWRPTAVALDTYGLGSDGRIWVADGYGSNLVHCFDRDGRLLWTSNCAASGVHFSCPHGLVVDHRNEIPRLLVADRRNRRIVAMSLDGEFLGYFGSNVLAYPSGLAIDEDVLWISDLYGAVVALDRAGAVLEIIGRSDAKRLLAWPNQTSALGLEAPRLSVGRLHSPHGIAVRPGGDVVVTEWLIGGRAILLSPRRS